MADISIDIPPPSTQSAPSPPSPVIDPTTPEGWKKLRNKFLKGFFMIDKFSSVKECAHSVWKCLCWFAFDGGDHLMAMVCGVLWKALIVAGWILSIFSLNMNKFGALVHGGKAVAVILYCVILIFLILLIRAFKFWDDFNNMYKGLFVAGKLNTKKFWWRFVYSKHILKWFISSWIIAITIILSVRCEDKDFYGALSMGFTTMGLLVYEVRMDQLEDLYLSDSLIALTASWFGIKYKEKPLMWLIIWVCVAVILALKKGLKGWAAYSKRLKAKVGDHSSPLGNGNVNPTTSPLNPPRTVFSGSHVEHRRNQNFTIP